MIEIPSVQEIENRINEKKEEIGAFPRVIKIPSQLYIPLWMEFKIGVFKLYYHIEDAYHNIDCYAEADTISLWSQQSIYEFIQNIITINNEIKIEISHYSIKITFPSKVKEEVKKEIINYSLSEFTEWENNNVTIKFVEDIVVNF